MIKVLLSDEGMSYEQGEQLFVEAADWAKTHCQSFIEHAIVDVSDFSYTCDQIAEYSFDNEQDVIMFKLKYPCC